MPIILDGTTGITTPGITNTGTFVFQGPIQVPAGSAATASITTAAGANTGIFFPSSSSVAITTAGTQRFVVSAAGNVGIGTATPTTVLNYTFATINGSTGAGISLFNSNSDAAWIYATSAGLSISTETASPILFKINAATRATLDASGNLGIGTSSPTDTGGFGRVLDIQSATGGQVLVRDSDDTTKYARFSFDGGASNIAYIGAFGSGTQVAFISGGTAGTGEKMRLDASGNLGLGVTPSAWGANFKAFEIATGGNALWANTNGNNVLLSQNATFNGTNFTYSQSKQATYYEQLNGVHGWFTAPSGTAGNTITFTQAMTLDAPGNLILGLTSSSGIATSTPTYITLGALFSDTFGTASKAKLRLFEASGFIYGFGISSNLLENHVPSNASVAWFINNSERMRLNTSGYLTVPNQPMFAGEHNATEGPTAGDAFVNWTVNVNTVTSAWNASTGVYTVPVAGRYFVACSLLRNTGSGSGGVYLQQNGTNVIRLFYCDSGSADSGYAMGSGQTIVNCAINDTLRVIQETSGVSWYGDGTGLGNFTIYLIG